VTKQEEATNLQSHAIFPKECTEEEAASAASGVAFTRCSWAINERRCQRGEMEALTLRGFNQLKPLNFWAKKALHFVDKLFYDDTNQSNSISNRGSSPQFGI